MQLIIENKFFWIKIDFILLAIKPLTYFLADLENEKSTIDQVLGGLIEVYILIRETNFNDN